MLTTGLLQIQVPSASRPPEGAKARAERPTLRHHPERYAPEGAYILLSSQAPRLIYQ